MASLISGVSLVCSAIGLPWRPVSQIHVEEDRCCAASNVPRTKLRHFFLLWCITALQASGTLHPMPLHPMPSLSLIRKQQLVLLAHLTRRHSLVISVRGTWYGYVLAVAKQTPSGSFGKSQPRALHNDANLDLV